ncbi:iron-containing alcohol dehydrogenase [Vibrio sp. RC27]
MLNFSFQNSTKINFGTEQIASIAKEIPTSARVLITYGGGSIKQNGVYQQVEQALASHTWQEFSGIEPNPKYDTLMKAVELVKAEKIDYLLAIGGGSVIDGTKFIAAAALYEGEDPWDIITQRLPVKHALPIGAVLTLPATGSESNIGSVVTRDGHKLPFLAEAVRPKFAVLDPTVTLSLSPRQISNGVADAFVHVVEQYLTYPVNAKVQDRFAEGLLLTLKEEGPKAISEEQRNDLDVRSNIMWAASLALNGLIGSGVPQDWSTHMIGHELTGTYGIDHARSLTVVLPALLRNRTDAKRAKLLQYGERIWGITEGCEDERIEQAISATETFFRQMKMPVRLSEINISKSDIDILVNNLEVHQMTALGEDQQVTLEVSRKILTESL